MSQCLICNSPVDQFVSFGRMPIANGFLNKEDFEKEYFFELRVGFCEKCGMVQLLEQPKREMMFHDNYAFYSSTSSRMAVHFKEFSNFVRNNYLDGKDPFVAEIGSNDGIMLKNFAQAGIRHIGIEPSSNVADVAHSQGVNTISKFFDENVAREIVSEYGQADAFLGANCMCHIPYLHSVAEGIRILLKPQGVLIFEDPYLGDIIKKTSYDQIYDEHAFYFSLASVSNLFSRHGLEVFDVQHQNVHGGSMRYLIGHRGTRKVSDAFAAQQKKEESMGLHEPETYGRLRKNIARSRDDLMALLRDLRSKGKRIVGYAATSKSTTVTNYCGITPDLVEFISDTTPIKQGKFSPGVHIPVMPYEDFSKNPPDVALLFAWNHGEEIMAKEKSFRDNGGQWLVYVPAVKLL